MVCELWKTKLDTYADGELPEDEMQTFNAHLRTCSSCAGNALARVQLMRAVQVAGKRFTPTSEFRKRVEKRISSPKSSRIIWPAWAFAVAATFIVVLGIFIPRYFGSRSGAAQMLSEIADLHAATLASTSPVDVVSTDKHTVKPWFQGKIPFSFNLPDVQNSEFTLVGGRMTYLKQTPGAHLIYNVRAHHISVFVFQERSLAAELAGDSQSSQKVPYNTETWSQDGLRYFVIGDASPADINHLAALFKASGS